MGEYEVDGTYYVHERVYIIVYEISVPTGLIKIFLFTQDRTFQRTEIVQGQA